MDQRSTERAAIVLPGAGFGPYAPLLMYSGNAAAARGAEVHAVSWLDFGDLDHEDPAKIGQWVAAQVAPVVDTWADAHPDSRPLIVGKSLGTYAAELVADRGLPAIWLTPHLTVAWVVEALRRASAPMLLVGGTADELWDGAVARELSPHVLEVADADHGMNVPGPLAASAAVLGSVASAVGGLPRPGGLAAARLSLPSTPNPRLGQLVEFPSACVLTEDEP